MASIRRSLYDGPWERGKAGLKAIQYMAAGLPVLAAKVGSLPDIVVHGQTGFLYQDGAEFIDFAEQLAAEEKLRTRMGEAGRLRAASCYSMHQWIDGVQRALSMAAESAAKRWARLSW